MIIELNNYSYIIHLPHQSSKSPALQNASSDSKVYGSLTGFKHGTIVNIDEFRSHFTFTGDAILVLDLDWVTLSYKANPALYTCHIVDRPQKLYCQCERRLLQPILDAFTLSEIWIQQVVPKCSLYLQDIELNDTFLYLGPDYSIYLDNHTCKNINFSLVWLINALCQTFELDEYYAYRLLDCTAAVLDITDQHRWHETVNKLGNALCVNHAELTLLTVKFAQLLQRKLSKFKRISVINHCIAELHDKLHARSVSPTYAHLSRHKILHKLLSALLR